MSTHNIDFHAETFSYSFRIKKIIRLHSEGIDQQAHLCNLITAFVDCLKEAWKTAETTGEN